MLQPTNFSSRSHTFVMIRLDLVFLGSVRSGSSSLNLELEPAHFAVFRTRTEPELYLWVRFGFSSKFMNKFGFNHVIWQILHALKLLNKKNFFLISIRKMCFFDMWIICIIIIYAIVRDSCIIYVYYINININMGCNT